MTLFFFLRLVGDLSLFYAVANAFLCMTSCDVTFVPLIVLSLCGALAYFTAMSDKVYPAFAGVLGGQKPTIRVRDMTSRWGVCYMKRRQITFALQLYNMPPAAQIYVVVHEYCHFLQPNHSPAFWAEVEKLLPDWKERRALLK